MRTITPASSIPLPTMANGPVKGPRPPARRGTRLMAASYVIDFRHHARGDLLGRLLSSRRRGRGRRLGKWVLAPARTMCARRRRGRGRRATTKWIGRLFGHLSARRRRGGRRRGGRATTKGVLFGHLGLRAMPRRGHSRRRGSKRVGGHSRRRGTKRVGSSGRCRASKGVGGCSLRKGIGGYGRMPLPCRRRDVVRAKERRGGILRGTRRHRRLALGR